MSPEIVHEPERQRFVAYVEGREAEITYRMRGAATMDLDHTFVPPEGRGMGLAGRLAAAALVHARAQGWKVVPTCPYVAAFLDKHPEYEDLRA